MVEDEFLRLIVEVLTTWLLHFSCYFYVSLWFHNFCFGGDKAWPVHRWGHLSNQSPMFHPNALLEDKNSKAGFGRCGQGGLQPIIHDNTLTQIRESHQQNKDTIQQDRKCCTTTYWGERGNIFKGQENSLLNLTIHARLCQLRIINCHFLIIKKSSNSKHSKPSEVLQHKLQIISPLLFLMRKAWVLATLLPQGSHNIVSFWSMLALQNH